MIVNTLKQSTLRRDVHVSHVHVCICVPPPPCTVHAILGLKGSSIRPPSQPHPLEPNPLVRQPDTEERQRVGAAATPTAAAVREGLRPSVGSRESRRGERGVDARTHRCVCHTQSHIYLIGPKRK